MHTIIMKAEALSKVDALRVSSYAIITCTFTGKDRTNAPRVLIKAYRSVTFDSLISPLIIAARNSRSVLVRVYDSRS